LESQASVRAAAKTFLAAHPTLDVLVLSAGIFAKARAETEDGIEKTFAVNYLSHFLLANLLKGALEKAAPSRVVLIASRYGGAKINFDDLMLKTTKFSIMSSVPRTKLAEVLFAQEAAERWAAAGIRVNAIHPGLVARTQLLEEVRGPFRFLTNLFGGTPEQGADTAVWLASSPEAADITGKLMEKRKPAATPGQGSDPAARKRLWDESMRLAKLLA
ncbi:MAG TPA: SDR family NAD(P)-dependent oxidoreductase, partial [Gemmatimonadaceae bacterium]